MKAEPSQEDRMYDDRHDQQLMTQEHDTRRGHHNPSDPQSNTSVDHTLVIGKDESFSTEAMKNEDITAIMDKLTTVERPLDPLGSSNPKSALYWVKKG